MPLPDLHSPNDRLQQLTGFILGSVVFTYLFTVCLLINFLQSLSLVIRPISRRQFRAINTGLAGFWWGQCVSIAEIAGVEAVFSGDVIPRSENSILLCNHQTMADIPFVFFLAKRADRIGDMKWYVKDVLKWVPGIGWGMFFLDCIFVKRSWHRDKSSIDATFKNLTDDQVPAMVVCFAEGTRCTPAKLARSREFALENGFTPQQHLLIPRAKGFTATVTGMRSYLDAVYDLTLGYEQGVPTLWQYARGYAMRAHLHFRRFPADTLPESEVELKNWLTQRYVEKDNLLDAFYRDGQFPGPQKASRGPQPSKSSDST